MPKKPGATRARKQSSKPKAGKSIELVHSRVSPGQAAQQETDEIGTRSLAPAAVALVPAGTLRKEVANVSVSTTDTIAVGRALPRRREGAQRYRQNRPLITAEEYAYVKQDLKTIGLLTVLMVIIIVILSVLLT
ncbi:MAG TPA: hypothetical protein VEU97_06485 [Ktedonobacteraceae bacterium]|nr:hypothetical protein [Ktedonobacteraceae bacterium]